MCGFVGCIRNKENIDLGNIIESMNMLIEHRGPDDEGYYADGNVSLGFRRLSIIALESGHQPLSYENERYWIVFNGEIYNYLELRDELLQLGYEFTTESDTEVVVGLYSVYKEEVVSRLRGMFSFLIWDKHLKILFGARDPFGIKPFYYSEQEDITYFASEEKSILATNEIRKDLHRESLHHYLSFQYVPEPATMITSIKKLPSGHYFTKKAGKQLEIKSYWKPSFPIKISEENKLITEIQNVLRDSVSKHMISDVPVGSFLSGGIDSSFIVALAKEIHPKIKTFTVGFANEGFSEVDVANETAYALNVENHSYIITPDEFMKELPNIIYHMDDPLADPAAIPLYFVSREARKQVTVVLSGEGADELFGGYNIYREPHSLRIFNGLPMFLKQILLKLSKIIPDGVKGKSFLERGTTPLEDRYIGNAKIFEQLEKERLLVNVANLFDYQKVTNPIYQLSSEYDPITTMQNVDIHTWLRGDILLKADRMTMAHSLELRVPFLDKEVFKIASSIHPSYKVTDTTTKYILRKAAEGIVPHHVLNRKKLGFPVPIRHWLKDEMYDWAKNIIQTSDTEHIFNKQEVLNLLEEHCQNKKDNSRKIWTVIVFILWYQMFVEQTSKQSDELKIKETVLLGV